MQNKGNETVKLQPTQDDQRRRGHRQREQSHTDSPCPGECVDQLLVGEGGRGGGVVKTKAQVIYVHVTCILCNVLAKII